MAWLSLRPVTDAGGHHLAWIQDDVVPAYLRTLVLSLTFAVILSEVLQVRSRWQHRKIPGPIGLPLLGNILSIKKLGLHNYIEECRKRYGNTFKIWMGPRVWIIMADPSIARPINNKLMVRTDTPNILFDDHGLSNYTLFNVSGELWRSLRLAWQSAFKSSSLEEYSTLMSSSAVRLRNKLSRSADTGAVVDIWRELGDMTLDVVGSSAFGVNLQTLDEKRPSDQEADGLVHALRVVFQKFGITSFTTGYQGALLLFPAVAPLIRPISWLLPDAGLRQAREGCKTIKGRGFGLIREWRAAHPKVGDAMDNSSSQAVNGKSATQLANSNGSRCPFAGKQAPGNFLGLILGAVDDGEGAGHGHVNDRMVAAQATTFFLAGYETTANTLAFTIYCLATNKEAERRLLEEVDGFFGAGKDTVSVEDVDEKFPYVEAVVKEALRIFPPVPLTNRRATARVRVGDYTVAKGTTLATAVWSIHHNPAIWPQAADFKPERFLPEHEDLASRAPFAHLPFGAGPRMCVGWRFAMQEAKLALIHLYRRYTFELAEGVAPIKTVARLTLQPLGGMPVRIKSRQ